MPFLSLRVNVPVYTPLPAYRFVVEAVVANRLVLVLLVIVALLANRLVKIAVIEFKRVAKKLVLVELEEVLLPSASTKKLAFSTQDDPFHLNVVLVAVPEATCTASTVIGLYTPPSTETSNLVVVALYLTLPLPVEDVAALLPAKTSR